MVLIERAVIGVGNSQGLHAFARLDGTLERIHQGALDAIAGTPIEGEGPTDYKGLLTVTGFQVETPGQEFRTLIDNRRGYRGNPEKERRGKMIGNMTPEGGAVHFQSISRVNWKNFTIDPGNQGGYLHDLSHRDCFAATFWIEALEELGGAETEESKDSILRRSNNLPNLQGKFSFNERTLYLNNLPLATARGKGADVEVDLEFGSYHSATRQAMDEVPGTLSIGLNVNAGPLIEVWNPRIPLGLHGMYSPLSKELYENGREVPIVVRYADLGQLDRMVLRAEPDCLRHVRMDILTTVTTMTPDANLGKNYPFERGMTIEQDVYPDQIGEFLRRYDRNHRLRS